MADSTCIKQMTTILSEKQNTWVKASLSQSLQVDKDANTYVCSVALNRSGRPTQLAARLSGPDVQIYDTDTLQKTTTVNTSLLTALRFCPESEDILWTCSADGKIKTWDLRSSTVKPTEQWQDDSEGALKPLLSFDVDKTAKLVCAGSELVREDAFLLFWDRRSTKLLGGYWESHTDDITEVTFNPTECHLVASGSTDGLINIFDVQESTEEDALQTTLNTNSSVASLRWLTKNDKSQSLACITHTEDFQLWDTEEALQKTTWNRSYIQSILKDKWSADYWTDVLTSSDVVAGNARGDACVLSFNTNYLQPRFLLEGGHTGGVRCASWLTQDELLITGGEDGQLCLWRCTDLQETMQTQLVTKMASLKTSRPHQQKPYLHK